MAEGARLGEVLLGTFRCGELLASGRTTEVYKVQHRLLAQWRAQQGLQFRGFADMTVAEVVAHTGLPPESARLARTRLASEPILWQDSDQALERFRELARTAGLRLLQGGRFLHLLGDMDKGRAVCRIVAWYRTQGWQGITSLALGDSGNDRDMLLSVDIPVIIRKKDGSHLELPQRPDAIVTQLSGPAGWNQAINGLLDSRGR